MQIRKDREYYLLFGQKVGDVVPESFSRRIDIKWKILNEKDKQYVGFDYLFDVFKDPWIFTRERVIEAVAENLKIHPGSIISSSTKTGNPHVMQVIVKIPLLLVQDQLLVSEGEEILITNNEAKAETTITPGPTCVIL